MSFAACKFTELMEALRPSHFTVDRTGAVHPSETTAKRYQDYEDYESLPFDRKISNVSAAVQNAMASFLDTRDGTDGMML
jgi:hypothetical protein